jgi:hypothetical protein
MGKFIYARICLVCVLALGCGSENSQIKVYPVHGKVLVKGQPAVGARVVFYPAMAEVEGKKLPTPAGETNETGEYQLGSYRADDGAPQGDYKVTIAWPEPPPPNPSGVFSQKDRLGGRYANPDNSKLAAHVDKGGGEVPPFDLK